MDGLSGGEGVFLPCSFWLVDALKMAGREPEARELFERLLGLRNDLGLLAEEYDPVAQRQLGNFPQAFTHLALINAVSQVIADEMTEDREPEERAVFSEMLAAREDDGPGHIEG